MDLPRNGKLDYYGQMNGQGGMGDSNDMIEEEMCETLKKGATAKTNGYLSGYWEMEYSRSFL